MPTIIVSYRYSVSPDLVLDQQATWTGPAQGRSIATIMSDLRGLHSAATDVAITGIAWEDGDGGEDREFPAEPAEPPSRAAALAKRWGAAGRKAPPPARLSAGWRGGRS